ncbi:MAG TPA: GNAT family N-acetyltransferase, partial [Steroidobacteraceae bacterium]|nr:GNAT family N-acetyltransferase [Steroidobacteraceae bacterium]
ARASADLYAAAPAEMRARVLRTGEVTVFCLPALPVSYFNRVVGLGNEQAATEADLDRVMEIYSSSGVGEYWIQLSPSARPAELPRMLAARGFASPPRRSWSKFLRATDSAPPVNCEYTIRPARPADASAVAQVVATAYGMPPAIAPWFAGLVGRPNWQVWVAEQAGAIVATGSLHIDGRHGWLGVGATRASHRGRGAQSSLLAARIAAARQAGCEIVATETGDPVADEKNQSLENIRRAGFEWVCSRVNYRNGGA